MKPKIRILQAGYGNTFSIRKALKQAGARIVDRGEDGVVLPGVGAFDTAANNKAEAARALVEGKPFLGICLGMQLLFESSQEGNAKGLGVLEGRVKRLRFPTLPHMGWNTVEPAGGRLLDGVQKPWFYFVHSYACPENKFATGWTTYGQRFDSAVEKGNVFGVQFHPEKSGESGAKVMENFVEAVLQWR